MRRCNKVVKFEEGRCGVRFGFKHVKCGPGDLSTFQRSIKIGLVDNATTSAIDHPYAVLHPRNRVLVDQIAGGVRQGNMDGDEIRLLEHVVKSDELQTARQMGVRIDEGIVGND